MNLVIQGTGDVLASLSRLACLARTDEVFQVNTKVAVLGNAHDSPTISAHCDQAGIDFSFVPECTQLSDFGLIVFDMDSTLISAECVDEIADLFNVKSQVAGITAAAMNGEVNYHTSLKQRLALLKGAPTSILEQAWLERIQLSPGVEKLFATLKKAGIKTMLATSGFSFFTERLDAILGFDFAVHNTLEIINNRITGNLLGTVVDARAKSEALINARERLGLLRDQVIAIGDGANDLDMMKAAGVSIAYHAKPIVRQCATYALNFVGLDGVLHLLPSSPYFRKVLSSDSNQPCDR